MDTFLLEIGAEEIPAGYIEPALAALSAAITGKLDKSRIEHGDCRMFGTPRRLAIVIEGVANKQATETVVTTGPPAKIAYDDQGHPTRAAEKFAQKVGLDVGSLIVKDTPRGQYVCAVQDQQGQATIDILAQTLPELILATPFPKSMRWSDLTIAFARPIHSVLALLGSEVIAFTVGDIASGRQTRGHSFMAPALITLDWPDAYVDALHAAHVIVDIDRRRDEIATAVAQAAQDAGGQVLSDAPLLDTVTNLVETPVVAAGRFDERFLELPRQVLITSMREHQKYFAVVDADDHLLSTFLVVNNTKATDMALVTSGHERVLRARLEDALFFYRNDLQTPMAQMAEKLKTVLFQADLGSIHEKSQRIEHLARWLADQIDDRAQLAEQAGRAAQLCKADLVSQVVVEFPKLQGAMGRIYAAAAGEAPDVAAAVEEHYRPIFSGAPLPETMTGAVLAIADKLDSICACFSVGLAPTGTSDPYALRRQAIGILQILHRFDFHIDLDALIAESLSRLVDKAKIDTRDAQRQVHAFIYDRLSFCLQDDGYAKDSIAAVVAVADVSVPRLWQRVAALEEFKKRDEFAPLAAGFKRVANILRKSGQAGPSGPVDPSRFEHDAERMLWDAFQHIDGSVRACLAENRIEPALAAMAGLHQAVDRFFDAVMVMAEDAHVRANRLAMLDAIADMFTLVADFTKINV